mgnify:CR=1 FL=1
MKKGIRRYFIILIVIIVCIVTLVDCTNTQTRQEERTSASHLIINWENEVQIFDADAMENTGMVENIETLERTSRVIDHEAEPGLTQWVLNKYSHRMNTL